MSSPSLLSSPSNSEDHDANPDQVPPSSTTSSVPQSIIDSLRWLRATPDVFPFLPVSNAVRLTLNICKMLPAVSEIISHQVLAGMAGEDLLSDFGEMFRAIRSIHTLARKLSRRGFFKSIKFSISSNDSLVELLQYQATLGVAKLKFQFKAALKETERSNASCHGGSDSGSDSSRPSSTNATNSGSGTASNVYGVQNITITMHTYHGVFAYEV